MADSTNLKLPYIAAAQAQKHVTHNEAIRALDALVQLSVKDRDLATPPATPEDGDRYIVAASPTGTWVGQEHRIAAFQDGAWNTYAPVAGWLAWVADEEVIVAFDGSSWISPLSGSGPSTLPILGINSTADLTNRLTVAAGASLFSHDGAGHQLKLNKAAAGDTASILYQDGFSGRAEIGLTGDDDFHFKVSPDGSTWNDAIIIDKSTGIVTLSATSVTNEALAAVPTATIKGRATAGAGSPADLTTAQATALLDAMVGDAGSGGAKGLVPAPATGDATKFLKGDGTWGMPAGGGGGEANTASNVNAGGVGVFKQKTGVDLEFRGINAGSSKVTVATSNQAMIAAAFPSFGDTPPVIVDWLPWNHTFGGNHNFGMVLMHGGTLYIDDGKPLPAHRADRANLREIAPTVYFNVPKGFEVLLPFLDRSRRCARASSAACNAVLCGRRAVAACMGRTRHLALDARRAHHDDDLARVDRNRALRALCHRQGAPARRDRHSRRRRRSEARAECRQARAAAQGPLVTPGYWREPELTARRSTTKAIYRLGDALRFADDTDPAKGFVFDGRVAEDFKLATGTWVSVGPLRARLSRISRRWPAMSSSPATTATR